MFGELSEKFTAIFSTLVGKKKLSEENVADAVRKIRLALLDADVNYGVAKNLIQNVKKKALGEELLKSVSASEQFIKIVHDELEELLGGEEMKLALDTMPATLMLVGLQGSGKTTHAAKLAHFYRKKKPLLVACDLQRPAAIEQLHVLGKKSDIPVFSLEDEEKPIKVVKAALVFAREHRHHLIIFDTAGRLHTDEALMKELDEIKRFINPNETLFVANAATGQDAVRAATDFDTHLGITGSILTMLDGDARGGAAISIRQVTGKPLVFEGIGEKIDDLQPFHAGSMADRILGMGDTVNLVRKAKEHISDQEADALEEKMRKASFTYVDFLKQMGAVRKMGSFGGLMKMMPGAPKQMSNLDQKEAEFNKIEAIILSMTPDERLVKVDLDILRSKRIARGSGADLADVTRMRKSFKEMRKFFKGGKGQKMMSQLGKKKNFGGMDKLWR